VGVAGSMADVVPSSASLLVDKVAVAS